MKNKKILSTKFFAYIMYAVIIWFAVTFLIYPNLNILKVIFFQNGTFKTDSVQKLFSSPRAVKSLKNSFILATTLLFTVNFIGIFLVLVIDYFDVKGAKILKLGYMTTLIYGGVVLASGYKFVYGANGIITRTLLKIFPGMNPDWFEGYGAVAFIMTFAVTSNHVIFLSNAIRKIDYSTIEAAKNMGASQFYILRKVVLPVLKPTIYAITVLLYITGLGATSAPLIVGGKNFQTIGPMILTFSQTVTSRDLAAVLALVLGIATLILLSFMIYFEKKGNFMSVSKTKSVIVKQKINNPIINIAVHIAAYILFFIYIIPVIFVILFSFTNSKSISTGVITGFTLQNYIDVFSNITVLKPFITSIVYSAGASVIVVILTLAVSRILHKYKNKWSLVLEYVMLIPWILPATLIAIGLITAFDKKNPLVFGNILTGTVWILLIAYVIVKIPFSLRMLKATFFSIDNELEEAATSLGADTFYTFRKVIFPIILPSTMAILALNFNSLLADYDLTVFLYHPLLRTLGIVIRNSTDATQTLKDSQAIALVYSVVLMIIASITLYLIYGKNDSKK
ncbi:MAG: iron ABC transporter permease [Leptotrichiaceae bacterium]|nr:iron ABC transporter permease [Leptotrichiaceae bacterium]